MGLTAGKGMIAVSILGILHAAYSAYEHLSLLKALDRPTPNTLPIDIIFECFVALGLFIVGAILDAPAFKENSWASEMRTRKIGDVDSRLGFATFNHRGRLLFGKGNVSAEK
ncbi:Membrane magnesium transporter [Ceratobasidium sp. AG-Ba]|nr:Membrane magnesium transporter [Ceratobasidium sp. AG-Ba]QRW02718.1 Membrane magnesium transporter [Ceratobasidium sp. AG-Ba]